MLDSRPVQLPDCPGVCVQEITPIVPETTVASIPPKKVVTTEISLWLLPCCMFVECSCPPKNEHPMHIVCCSCNGCFCCCGKEMPPYTMLTTCSCCCIGYMGKNVPCAHLLVCDCC